MTVGPPTGWVWGSAFKYLKYDLLQWSDLKIIYISQFMSEGEVSSNLSFSKFNIILGDKKIMDFFDFLVHFF